MITMKHKMAYIEAKALFTELKLKARSHFIEILMILTKYVFDVSVRFTEYSVTVESVTLRFYCICNIFSMGLFYTFPHYSNHPGTEEFS